MTAESEGRVRLTDAQAAWMRAHLDYGSPVTMAWLDGDKQPVNGPPETWVYLFARWKNGSTRMLHADEREALAPYFDPGKWALTPAGRRALENSHDE